MKRDYTARRGRRFAANANAPSCSVLLRPAPSCSATTKHPVTDRSLRSPSHVHRSAAIRAADDVAAPVHIHTHRTTLIRGGARGAFGCDDYHDHSRRPEFPAQDHGFRGAVPFPTTRRSTS